MKNLQLIFCSIILLIFSFSNLSAQLDRTEVIDKTKTVLAFMPDGFAISIALIDGGSTEYIGLEKREGAWELLDLKDSLFEIGSITKVFTSTLLAKKVVDKRIKLKHKVNKVFPFKFKDNIKLSYLSLANHSSGLDRLPSNILPLLATNPENPYKDYTNELLDTYLKRQLRIKESKMPEYAYSNLGAGILAYAIEKREKRTFEELLEEYIFEPYKMSSTSYEGQTSFDGLDANGEKTGNWEFNAMKGAGGLISSVKDLSRFVRAQFDAEEEALALTRKATFEVSSEMSVGLGWHIFKANTEDKFYWHNGGTGGFTSSLAFRTTNSTGVVILSNMTALSPKSRVMDPLCFELLDLLQKK